MGKRIANIHRHATYQPTKLRVVNAYYIRFLFLYFWKMDHIKVYVDDIYYSIFLLPVYNKNHSIRAGEETYSVPSDHEVSIMRLVSMGFSREQAIESLQSTVSL